MSVLGHWNDSGNVSWSLVSALTSLDGKYCEWSTDVLIVEEYNFNIWNNSDKFEYKKTLNAFCFSLALS